MKKYLLFGAVVIVALLALGVAGYAYAQTQTPPTPYGGMMGGGAGMMGGAGRMNGRGMMNGQGRGMMGGGAGMMGGYSMMGGQMGPVHTYMLPVLAEKLGLSVDELNTRLANGETPYAIAQAQGKTAEEITALFDAAHDAALQAALDAGAINQEQADWMEQHHEDMWAQGSMPCHGTVK